jgi:hypothetical protein
LYGVWNLVSHTKGRRHVEIWEQGAEKNIWTYEVGNGRRLEDT